MGGKTAFLVFDHREDDYPAGVARQAMELEPRITGFSNKKSLEAGDILICEDGEDGPIRAAIEVKFQNDLRNCLGTSRDHFKHQLERLKGVGGEAVYRAVLLVGSLDRLEEQYQKAFNTIASRISVGRGDQRIETRIVTSVDLLGHFLAKLTEALLSSPVRGGEDAGSLSVQRLNRSLKRPKAFTPREYLFHCLCNVKGLGSSKAEVISAKYETLDALMRTSDHAALSEMEIAGRRLGPAMATAIMESMGLPAPEPKRKKTK